MLYLRFQNRLSDNYKVQVNDLYSSVYPSVLLSLISWFPWTNAQHSWFYFINQSWFNDIWSSFIMFIMIKKMFIYGTPHPNRNPHPIPQPNPHPPAPTPAPNVSLPLRFPGLSYTNLTHWGRDKMAAISQTTLSNAFSCLKMYEFRSRFHWNLFLRFELTIFHHWFR